MSLLGIVAQLLYHACQARASKQTVPPTFEDARRTLFRMADHDSDGKLLNVRHFSQGWEIWEWDRIFQSSLELRLIYKEPSELQKSFHKAPKQTRAHIQQGVLDFRDYVALSKHSLGEVVKQAKQKELLAVRANALLLLHLWDAANKTYKEALKFGVVDSDGLEETAHSLSILGLYLEHTWLWRFLLDHASTGSGEQSIQNLANKLSQALPRSTETAKLAPPLPAYANSSYLNRMRSSPASHCVDAIASRENVIAALEESRPIRLRRANLISGIETWMSAMRAMKDDVMLFKSVPDNTFYATIPPPKNSVATEFRWGVVPAAVPLRVRDIQAAASIKNATFYAVQSRLASTPKLHDIVTPNLAIAKGLNVTSVNSWTLLGGGAVSLLHYDASENILAQVHGSKELLMFPPLEGVHLGYERRPQAKLKFDCCPPKFTQILQAKDEVQWAVNQGDADIRQPEDWPVLQHGSPMFCRLDEGDALVLPSYWHHLVISYAGAADACESCGALSNLAVNYWYKPLQADGVKEMDLCSQAVQKGYCNVASGFVRNLCQSSCDSYTSSGADASSAKPKARSDL